jgi:FeS assembly SUF system protein
MNRLPVVQTPAPLSSDDQSKPANESAQSSIATMTRDATAAAALEPRIVDALASVFDPEIPVNIYELGLIYDIIVDARHAVGIRMTLTAPSCPSAQALPAEVKQKVAEVPGVADVTVDVVWDPPWDRERMSEAAKLQLGLF